MPHAVIVDCRVQERSHIVAGSLVLIIEVSPGEQRIGIGPFVHSTLNVYVIRMLCECEGEGEAAPPNAIPVLDAARVATATSVACMFSACVSSHKPRNILKNSKPMMSPRSNRARVDTCSGTMY